MGDASVPTLHHTTPAPTRSGILTPGLWWNPKLPGRLTTRLVVRYYIHAVRKSQ